MITENTYFEEILRCSSMGDDLLGPVIASIISLEVQVYDRH